MGTTIVKATGSTNSRPSEGIPTGRLSSSVLNVRSGKATDSCSCVSLWLTLLCPCHPRSKVETDSGRCAAASYSLRCRLYQAECRYRRSPRLQLHPTRVISRPEDHQERTVIRDCAAPTAKCAASGLESASSEEPRRSLARAHRNCLGSLAMWLTKCRASSSGRPLTW